MVKNPEQAVFQYNHSTDYVREVLRLATLYQAWDPLGSEWVWPVTDAQDPFSAVTGSGGEPAGITIHCPPGAWVRAIHAGTVTSVTGRSVTLDLGDGLTVTEEGIRPTLSTAQAIHAGEPLGIAAARGVTVSMEEQGVPLPVLWFVSPSAPNLASTPPLTMATQPANVP